jgi:hypothetical protein
MMEQAYLQVVRELVQKLRAAYFQGVVVRLAAVLLLSAEWIAN